MDPEVITKSIGLVPFRQWKVGDPRTSPKGGALPGDNAKSFWATRLHTEKKISSGEQSLEAFLAEANIRLRQHREFLLGVVAGGGCVEYFVGWFGESSFGATLEPSLLLATADLGVSLGLDIYPG